MTLVLSRFSRPGLAQAIAVLVSLAAAILVLIASSSFAPVRAEGGRNAAIIGGLAAGVLGGAAAGAIIGSGRRAPGPAEYGAEIEDVEEAAPRYVPTCRIARKRVWLDDESYTYRRVEVCE